MPEWTGKWSDEDPSWTNQLRQLLQFSKDVRLTGLRLRLRLRARLRVRVRVGVRVRVRVTGSNVCHTGIEPSPSAYITI